MDFIQIGDRKRRRIRVSWLGRLALASLGLLAAAAAAADRDISFDIGVETRGAALLTLAESADVQIAFAPGEGDMYENAPALQGVLSVEQALARLLEHSSLHYYFISDDFIVVSRDDPRAARPLAAAGRSEVSGGHRSYLARAQDANADVAAARLGTTGGADQPQRSHRAPIEEVVVTASKRSGTVSDLPMSITAISHMDIERKSLVSMVDFMATLPGANMADRGAGRNSIIIRGIAARPESDRNVGVYVGEVPVSGLAMFGNADLKLVDMDRIEVLRGPQGTLYGSSSMSGTVRTIPTPPNLSRIEGKVGASYSQTGEKGGDNRMLQGVLNIPVIEDVLALRAVAYGFDESGIYENRAADYPAIADLAAAFGAPELAKNRDDVGQQDFRGGRVAALWEPTDSFSTTVTYITQRLDQTGFPEEWSDVGKFQQARLQLVPASLLDYLHTSGGDEELLDDIDVVNVEINYDFGWASLVSSSSWIDELSTRNTEVATVFGSPVTQLQTQDVEVFSEELRLTSQFSGPFQFLAGVYREEINGDREFTNHYAGDPAFNPLGGVEFFTGDTGRKVRQTAYFGEASYDLTDTLALTLGGRWFHYNSDSYTKFSGAIPGDPPASLLDSSESNDSYKVNLTYRPNDDALIYAQWVQGFRLGYPQSPLVRPDCDVDGDGVIDGSNVPSGVSNVLSDSLENYEIGGKFTLLDGRLVLNVAAYRINWEKIPILKFFQCGAEITINAGEARSEGLEAEASLYLSDSVRIDLGVSHVDPELTADAADLGQSGDRLPGSPSTNFNLGVQYDFRFGGRPSYVRADWSYVGGYYNNFQEDGIEIGDYQMLNARLGTEIERFHIELFAKNLLNADEFSWIQDVFGGRRAYRIRPRTAGLEVSYRF